MFWSWRDQVCARELQDIEERIRTAVTPRTRFLETGPKILEFAEGDVYQHLVGIWQRSSLQLHHQCQANGIRYYHFLQPNQYVAGSKELNSEERRQAFDEHHAYRLGVEKGYPLLVAAGQNLVQEGVQFRDLTHVFSDIGDTVYRDTCCHLNQRGDEILATNIARAILADVSIDIAWRPGAKVR